MQNCRKNISISKVNLSELEIESVVYIILGLLILHELSELDDSYS